MATRAGLEIDESDQFSEFLKGKGVNQEVIDDLKMNRIDRKLFFEMKECDIKEIAPCMADRLTLRRIIKENDANDLKEPIPISKTVCKSFLALNIIPSFLLSVSSLLSFLHSISYYRILRKVGPVKPGVMIAGLLSSESQKHFPIGP